MSEPRSGIEHNDVIDDARDEPAAGRFVLIMIERRPWGTTRAQLDELDLKVHSYLAFVRDGFLYRVRPEAEQRSVAFELQCVKRPGLLARRRIDSLRRHLRGHHIDFHVAVVDR
jgi:hypothetical protein